MLLSTFAQVATILAKNNAISGFEEVKINQT
jgi:hypothetical protein